MTSLEYHALHLFAHPGAYLVAHHVAVCGLLQLRMYRVVDLYVHCGENHMTSQYKHAGYRIPFHGSTLGDLGDCIASMAAHGHPHGALLASATIQCTAPPLE